MFNPLFRQRLNTRSRVLVLGATLLLVGAVAFSWGGFGSNALTGAATTNVEGSWSPLYILGGLALLGVVVAGVSGIMWGRRREIL
jgi:hypothetical protein